ncbi:MAG TPA: 2-hydroxyacyl-CoA dehydratase family protein [Dehalococcoidia bacterium]|nr:2-hydroxyacyl-CoA dehydratase family protein [Dehalococcoidia bacterium]
MVEVKRLEIKATKQLREIMALHFRELDEASKTRNKKIAWCSSVGPAELAESLGFLVYYYENHGAMLGTARLSSEYIPLANAYGYSPEICSYLTSDIGAFLKGETPLTKAYGIERVPRPDVLLYNTNQCRDVYDWMSFYAREFNVPLLGVNTPRTQRATREDTIKSVAAQFEGLVPHLESISGQRFDIDRFREVLALSLECTGIWQQVLNTSMTIPSPISFFDTCIHMGPAVVMRGRQEAIDYYRILLAELKERIEHGVSAVEGERHRFYWEGMPVWGKLRSMSDLFAMLKACIVVSTYCNSWVFPDFDPGDPFISMARAYSSIFIGMDDNYKENYMADKVEKYKVDGIIYHDAKTCPNNTNSRYGLPNRLSQRLGIPYLVINGDLCDLRLYSEEQTITNVEAYVEQIEEA